MYIISEKEKNPAPWHWDHETTHIPKPRSEEVKKLGYKIVL